MAFESGCDECAPPLFWRAIAARALDHLRVVALHRPPFVTPPLAQGRQPIVVAPPLVVLRATASLAEVALVAVFERHDRVRSV
jgi:hypothetical protein